MKQARKRLTYANVMSSIAVFLVLGGGAAFAATHLAKNSVGSAQLKRNAVTGAKIQKGAVTGSKIKLATLGTVPQAATFSGYSRKGTEKASASADEGTLAASLAAAPAVPLVSGGPFAVYGKCFDSGGSTRGVILISTTADGAIFASEEDGKNGTPVFLNAATAEGERELMQESIGPNNSAYFGVHTTEFAAMAPDGAAIRGDGQVAVKNGILANGNGLYGPGDVCLFAAELTTLGG
jgi:hypothetical protein